MKTIQKISKIITVILILAGITATIVIFRKQIRDLLKKLTATIKEKIKFCKSPDYEDFADV